jgi:hypothetical protein
VGRGGWAVELNVPLVEDADPQQTGECQCACSSAAPWRCCPLRNVTWKSMGTVRDGHVSCLQLQRLLTEVLQTAWRNTDDLQSRELQSSYQACVVSGTLSLLRCALFGSFWAFLALTIPSRCCAFLLALCVGEHWRDHNNNSCCDGNDFVFATHRISSGTNGLQDRRASWRNKGSKRR